MTGFERQKLNKNIIGTHNILSNYLNSKHSYYLIFLEFKNTLNKITHATRLNPCVLSAFEFLHPR